MSVRVAALQQEMMVAAFMCRDVTAYNRFVVSHQGELRESDKALMDFFLQQNAPTGVDDYNLFKTELANASSLRSVRDPRFCRRVDADFAVALGRNEPLARLLTELPYPVETGSMRCPQYAFQTTAIRNAAPRVRHRTWLGRLLDAIKAIFD